MGHDLSDHEQRVVDTAAAFAREVIAPDAARWEIDRTAPRMLFEAAGAAGLCGLIVPPDLGGQGLGATAMARVMEELASADFAAAFALVVHNGLAGNIARNGDTRHKDAHLPDLVAGRRIGAFLLTEPQGGSDAAAVRTRARRDGDGWVIDGDKAWVSNGAIADLLSVYAQTDPEQGHRGIACFLVGAAARGVIRQPPYAMLGGHALGACGITFAGVAVGEDGHFIPAGGGFKAAMAGIDAARVNVAAACCGMLGAGLDAALAFARERRAFGRAVTDFQGVQWMLADVATDLEAARSLAYRAAAALDGDDRGAATLLAAHAKKFATRAALARLADCMQAMGAWGLTHDHPLARHLAMAKIAHYLDGTTEIQNVVIARKLLDR